MEGLVTALHAEELGATYMTLLCVIKRIVSDL